MLETVRGEQRHILVDEFQDINRATGVLIRLLAGPAQHVWAVGDPNQAIYRFRGASPANIAAFQVEYPAATIVTLRRNYRLTPAIVAAANRFAATELPAPVEAAPETALVATRDDAGEAVHLFTAPDLAAELAGIAGEIQHLPHANGVACGITRHSAARERWCSA